MLLILSILSMSFGPPQLHPCVSACTHNTHTRTHMPRLADTMFYGHSAQEQLSSNEDNIVLGTRIT